MVKNLVNWERFWYLNDSNKENSFHFDVDGYLLDPNEYSGFSISHGNKNLKTFSSIYKEESKFILFLGELGSGKSSVFTTEKEKIETEINSDNNFSEWFDLGNYTDKEMENEFLNIIDKLKNNDKNFYIFLDSLDEFLLLEYSLNFLFDFFYKNQNQIFDLKNRVFLRFFCRNGYFNKRLEDRIEKYFGSGFIQYYLAPLRKKDIIYYLKTKVVLDSLFLEEVEKKQLVSLAIKPLTLDFLIKEYKKNNSLDIDSYNIYLNGLEGLCQESDSKRQDIKGKYNEKEKILVASKLALISIFCNKPWIYQGNSINSSEFDIKFSDISNSNEKINDNNFLINDELILETIKTGLFITITHERSKYSHQSYASFLAVEYILKKNTSTSELINLIFTKNGNIIPQIYETVALLSTKNTKLFDKVVRLNPEIFLLVDISSLDSNNKKEIIENLFYKYEKGTLLYPKQNIFNNYKKLFFQGIEDYLKKYLENKNDITKIIAIKIASSCNLLSLKDDILKISFDQNQSIYVRENAVLYFDQINNTSLREELKPLIFIENSNDPSCQIKGIVLNILYPEYTTIKDIVNSISLPQIDHFGIYEMFIYSVSKDIINSIDNEDIVKFLEFIKNSKILEFDYPIVRNKFRELSFEIINKSLDKIDDSNIYESLIDLIFPIIEEHKNLRIIDEIKNSKHRLKIANEILEKIEISKVRNLFYLSLIKVTDVDFLFSEIEKPNNINADKIFDLLINFYGIENKNYYERLEQFCNINTKYKNKYETIKKYSEEYKLKLIEESKKIQSYKLNQNNTDSLNEYFEAILLEIEKGNVVFWLHFIKDFFNWFCAGKSYGIESISEVKSIIVQKERINNLATIFLNKYIIEKADDENLGRWTFETFYYLYNQNESLIENLSIDLWEKWTPVLVYNIPFLDKYEKREIITSIFRLSFENANKEFMYTLEDYFNKLNKENLIINQTSIFSKFWDQKIGKFLLEFCSRSTTNERMKLYIYQILLKNKYDLDNTLIGNLINSLETSLDEEYKKLVICVFIEYLFNSSSLNWNIIWLVLSKNDDNSKNVILSLINHRKFNNDFFEKLKEENLGELYIWMNKNLIIEEPKITNEIDSYRNSKNISKNVFQEEAKDSLLNYLINKGTKNSYQTMEKILEEYPNINHIKNKVVEAKEKMLENTWNPISIKDLLDKINIVEDNEMNNIDIGILTVISVELDAALKALGIEKTNVEKTSDGTNVWFGKVKSNRDKRYYNIVLSSIGNAGNYDSASATIDMINTYSPKMMILVGIAAGMKSKIKIGNVVFSERVIGYESSALEKNGEIHRPEIPKISHSIQQDLNYYSNGDETRQLDLFKKINGQIPTTQDESKKAKFTKYVSNRISCNTSTIASGEKLLKNPSKLLYIREKIHGKTDVGEMEAIGFAKSCERKNVDWLVIRGISDFGDKFKDDSFHNFASLAATTVMVDFIQHGLNLDYKN